MVVVGVAVVVVVAVGVGVAVGVAVVVAVGVGVAVGVAVVVAVGVAVVVAVVVAVGVMDPVLATPPAPTAALPYGRGAFADACAVIIDAIEGDDTQPTLYELEADARAWYLDSRADGYPTSSWADGVGGATNVVHDFGTPDTPDLQTVPQHSDPTGDLVANRETDRVYAALREAYRKLDSAKKQIAHARSLIAGAVHPPDEIDTQREEARSREWCWSCLRLDVDGHRHCAPTYRDRDRFGNGARTPLCRNCYDWAAVHDEQLPPVGVVRAWREGVRVTSKVIAAAVAEEREVRRAVRAKKKRKR